ncbi:MAG: capsular polysaccharide export protein, LipB/KpsS family [Shimia sp.]
MTQPGAALTILKGWKAEKDAIFDALARVAGGAEVKPALGVSKLGFDETDARMRDCFARAKAVPRTGPARRAKRALLAGQYNWSRQHFMRHPDRIAVAWNGLGGSRRAFLVGARDSGAGALHVELAPFAGYVTIDPAGVNAESSVPRTRSALGPALSEARAEALAAALVPRAARAKGVGQEAGDLPETPFLFLPLQVPDDSQVRLFGGWAGSMRGFVEAVARAASHLPEGWHLRVKQHPSTRQKQSLVKDLEAARKVAGEKLVVDDRTDTFAQIRASRGVVTMNSSLGLQSFLLRKPVLVTGEAYFAQPGLVHPIESQGALDAALADPAAFTFDHAHRMEMLGHVLDRYLVP